MVWSFAVICHQSACYGCRSAHVRICQFCLQAALEKARSSEAMLTLSLEAANKVRQQAEVEHPRQLSA
jgi:hypothetical protein